MYRGIPRYISCGLLRLNCCRQRKQLNHMNTVSFIMQVMFLAVFVEDVITVENLQYADR